MAANRQSPRHAATTRHRRVVPRHAAPSTGIISGLPSLVPGFPSLSDLVPDGVKAAGSVASIAMTVAGVSMMSGGAYGYGSVVTIAPTNPTQAEVAGIQQVKPADRLGTSEALGGRGLPTPNGQVVSGPSSSLEAERLGRPASIWINSISTGSDLIDLGLQPDGVLEVPVDFGVAGWWKGGPRPGDPGPAVITGHLDSTNGPGVFAKLGRVKPGDEVTVRRNDGQKLTFAVTRIDRYPKRAFPTRNVYAGTDAAELRIITCGGTFDKSLGSYNDNIVVFAKLIDPLPRVPSSDSTSLSPTANGPRA
jgi:Sortase domain